MTGSLPARLVRANTFALAVALAPASLAIAADPPVIYDFPEGIACKFALHIESVGGNTVKKEFVDKDGHLSPDNLGGPRRETDFHQSQ